MRAPSLALLAFALCGCKATSQLVVGVITDLKVKAELSRIILEAARDGVTVQSRPWNISDRRDLEFVLPGSFNFFSEGGASPVVELKLEGYVSANDATPSVTRVSTVKLLPEQQLFYRMALVNACGAEKQAAKCGEGFSCIEGLCRATTVDSHTLKPYAAARATAIECDSGTAFIDTATCASAGGCQPLPVAPAGCVSGEFCQEGTRYVRDLEAARVLEFGEACVAAQGDTCSSTGVRCDRAGAGSERCRQACTANADCARRLPEATGLMVPANVAACAAGTCTFACDVFSTTDSGCAPGTRCDIVGSADDGKIAVDCVDVPSVPKNLAPGAACTGSLDCAPGATCVRSNSSTAASCRRLCGAGGSPSCASGETCSAILNGDSTPSSRYAICCPSGGCP